MVHKKAPKYDQKPSVKLSKNMKKILDKLKEHPRETYEDVIKRLVKGESDAKDVV